MIVGVLLILLAPSTADAKQLGQGIGQFAALSFIGGFLASFQEQNGNLLQARILKVAWILGCIGRDLCAHLSASVHHALGRSSRQPNRQVIGGSLASQHCARCLVLACQKIVDLAVGLVRPKRQIGAGIRVQDRRGSHQSSGCRPKSGWDRRCSWTQGLSSERGCRPAGACSCLPPNHESPVQSTLEVPHLMAKGSISS